MTKKISSYDVTIDRGHGAKYKLFDRKGKEKGIGYDSGAASGSFTEVKFANALQQDIKRFAEPFKKYGLNFYYTSDEIDTHGVYSSRKESLQARANYAAKRGSEEFVSMHFDERGLLGKKGIQIHYYDSQDKQLADDLNKDFNGSNPGVKVLNSASHDLCILKNHADIKGVLIEFGNKNEDALRNPKWREIVARSMVLSSVERAVAAGLEIPAAEVARLKGEYELAKNTSIGKQKLDNGAETMVATAEKPSKEEAKKGQVAKKAEPKLEKVDKDDQMLAAQVAFPKLKIKTIINGNIYAEGHGGDAVGTFMKEPGKIWVDKGFRDEHSDGNKVIDSVYGNIKHALPKTVEIVEIKGGRHIYAKGFGDTAIATYNEKDGDLWINPKFRDKISNGKATINLGLKEEKQRGEDPETRLKGLVADIQSSGIELRESQEVTAPKFAAPKAEHSYVHA